MKLKRFEVIREAMFMFIMISCLCGCRIITNTEKDIIDPSWGERKKQILSWASSEKKKVDEGSLKNSEYWTKYYRKTIELRPDLDDVLWFASEMIKISRIFEEGKITKAQFEDKQSQLTALLSREEKRRNNALLRAQTMESYGYQEGERFLLYRGSLFLDYSTTLQRKLNVAGPQFSSTMCDIFDDAIQCTTQNPPF